MFKGSRVQLGLQVSVRTHPGSWENYSSLTLKFFLWLQTKPKHNFFPDYSYMQCNLSSRSRSQLECTGPKPEYHFQNFVQTQLNTQKRPVRPWGLSVLSLQLTTAFSMHTTPSPTAPQLSHQQLQCTPCHRKSIFAVTVAQRWHLHLQLILLFVQLSVAYADCRERESLSVETWINVTKTKGWGSVWYAEVFWLSCKVCREKIIQ